MTVLHVDVVIAGRAKSQVGSGEGLSFRQQVRKMAGCVPVSAEQLGTE